MEHFLSNVLTDYLKKPDYATFMSYSRHTPPTFQKEIVKHLLVAFS